MNMSLFFVFLGAICLHFSIFVLFFGFFDFVYNFRVGLITIEYLYLSKTNDPVAKV